VCIYEQDKIETKFKQFFLATHDFVVKEMSAKE
jgi:hypothetical protein